MALKPPRLDPPSYNYPATQHVDDSSARSPRPARSPFLFRLFNGVLGSLSGGRLILGMIAGVGLWRSGEDFVNGIRSAFVPAEPVETVDVQTVVVHQIRSASELTTAVFTMEAVVPTSSTRTFAKY
jgi:hypothetical protein